MDRWLKSLLFREEDFKTYINTLCIKWDKIPEPTSEIRETERVFCVAHRMIARNALGRLLLRRYWSKGIGSVGSLTQNGKVLEIYPPLRKESCVATN